ncbi:hypothetical protein B0T25DRAFT_174631 [Lasiosphaeria hispida]|uniref:ER-bound oxygenase mpaB/mpaB'/Rubber oxygenase catalytic domain-containing protein n=1 Tax=Lasiosphaeria hispida TaxID=260671 RepID=A0AAJ0HN58_9PEZI|nr:hypothetical protein B0T25DRAFT_174631 [Lasiosphaeria hispida]
MFKARGTFGARWRDDAPVGLRSRGEKEVLCKEFRRFAMVLDMSLEMWPRRLEEFESYFEGQMRRLEGNGVSKESREGDGEGVVVWAGATVVLGVGDAGGEVGGGKLATEGVEGGLWAFGPDDLGSKGGLCGVGVVDMGG